MSRRAVIGLAVVVALVVVVGFAVALSGARSGGGDSESVASMPSSSYGSAREYDGGAMADAPAAPMPAGEMAAPYAADSGGMVTQGGVPVGAVGASLVRTAQISIEVQDPTVSVQDVRVAAAGLGGFVAEERSGRYVGWVVVRVPADALDRLVDQVATLGVVNDRSASVVDVTEEVVDLDARVASQEASVSRVRALLAEATSIGDVVSIESELSRREAELDSLTGRLAALQGQVEMSTLSVDLRTSSALPIEEQQTVGFLDGLGAGWSGLMALGAATGAVIGFVLPFLPVLAVLAGIVWLVARIVRRRRVGTGRTGPGGPAAAES